MTSRTLDALELRGGMYVRASDVRTGDLIIDLYAPDLQVLTVERDVEGVLLRGEIRHDVGMTLEARPDDYVCVVRAAGIDR